MELCAEEEAALSELIEVRKRGEEVKEFIASRLYEDLSHEIERDSMNGAIREYRNGFIEQRQAYESLADKGMLEASHPMPGITWFGDLTLEGRNYFENKKRRKKEKRKEKWSERRFSIALSLLTFLLGLLGSWLISNQVVDIAIKSLVNTWS